MHPIFSVWHHHGPFFRLDLFSSLVQVHLWSNVMRVCSSFRSAVMANSLVVHIMLKKGSELSPKLQCSWSSQEQVGIRSTCACFDHISFIRTRNYTSFFFLDSLFFKEYSIKISNFFSTSRLDCQLVQPIHQVYQNQMVNQFNRFIKFFLGGRVVGSSGLLANDSVFSILVPLFRLV